MLPHASLLESLAAIPLVGSLFAALLQTLRDVSAHDRQVMLMEIQQRFSLGASSHMSNVAFDKHAVFAEEYLSEVFRTLETLFREGPTEKVLPHASVLLALRQKHALWLTVPLDNKLQDFERALRTIGAADWFLRNTDRHESRQEKIDEMYKTFANVLGKENMGATWNNEPLSEEFAVSFVIRRLRSVLGIEELTALRSKLIQDASNT
jgi:hypothetical protein